MILDDGTAFVSTRRLPPTKIKVASLGFEKGVEGLVYKISCSESDRCYVGITQTPSKDAEGFYSRWRQHLHALRKGAHPSRRMQQDFKKYGEKSFKFSEIEICRVSVLLDREIYWQRALVALYSVDYCQSIASAVIDALPVETVRKLLTVERQQETTPAVVSESDSSSIYDGEYHPVKSAAI